MMHPREPAPPTSSLITASSSDIHPHHLPVEDDGPQSIPFGQYSIGEEALQQQQQHPTWYRMVLNCSKIHPNTETQINSASMGNLVWYSTTMDPGTAQLIQDQQHSYRIKYLIPDLPVSLSAHIQRQPPSWGLDRIDQRGDQLDGLYRYPETAGENVTIYVIDT